MILIIAICAVGSALLYYAIAKRRIGKKIKALEESGQLELFKRQMDQAQRDLKKNAFVEAQKQKHKEFRASQENKDSE